MRTAFDPKLHGFAFSNSFVNHVIRVPALQIDITTGGRCGGMAYACLDYWHNGLAVPENSSLPADGTVLADYIYARLLDSMFLNGVHFFTNMAALDHPTLLRGKGVARDTREDQYPALRASLDAGEPRVLGLCQARDVGGLGHDHQVVAIGYEDDATTSTVFIYDNNYPGQVCSLRFKTAYDPGDRAVHHSQGTDFRSFFVESYAPQHPAFLNDGHLLSETADPAIHLVRGGGRFWIPSPAEFEALGLDWSRVQETASGSLAHVATHPGDGTLVRERSAAEIDVVYGGFRFPIPSPEVFEALGLDWNRVRVIPDGSSAALRNAPRDETLLKSRTADEIYVVRGGQRHWIPNPPTFTAEGFSWANVHTVPETAIDLVPRGSDLPTSDVPAQPRSWAERPSGTIGTQDGDRIDYTIEPGAVADPNAVEFVLELGPGLSWRKELVLSDGTTSWTIVVKDATTSDRNGLYRDQLAAGSLTFRKAKAFGAVWDVHRLGNLDQLPVAARVTFTWVRD